LLSEADICHNEAMEDSGSEADLPLLMSPTGFGKHLLHEVELQSEVTNKRFKM
jgi:hypothetical protein